MPKIFVLCVLLFAAACGGACSTSICSGPTVEALKRIDAAVTGTDQIAQDEYAALVTDAREKYEEMQKCLPPEELNGKLNEHLRNAVIHYDEASDGWESGNDPRRRKRWELAREELNKIR